MKDGKGTRMGDTDARDRIAGTALAIVGVLLIAAALLNWFIPEESRSSTLAEQTSRQTTMDIVSPSVTVVEEGRSRETTSDTTKGQAGNSTKGIVIKGPTRSTTSTSTTTSRTTSPATKTTTTTSPPSGRRDAGITLGLLGFGFVSLVAGAFFPKISAITFPGGGGVTMVTGLKDTAKVLEERVAKLESLSKKQTAAIRELAKKVAGKPSPGG